MATLKVTIKEELVLNGKDVGNDNFIAIPSVTNADHRVFTCGTTEQSVLLFDAAVAAGTIKDNTLKYLRVTNLDSSSNVQLRIVGVASQYYAIIEPGESFILGNDDMYADATGTSASATAINIDSIHAKAVTTECEVEIFAATS